MTAGEPATGAGDVGLAERYEQLRRRALDGAPDGFRLGLAVLQRQGLAAWIRAWKEIGTGPAPPPPARAVAGAHGSDAVVAVLASMALAVAGAG